MTKRTNRKGWWLVWVLIGVIAGGITSVVVYGRQTGQFNLTLRWREGPPEWLLGRYGYRTVEAYGPQGPQEQLTGTIYGLGYADLVVHYKLPQLIFLGRDHRGEPILYRLPK